MYSCIRMKDRNTRDRSAMNYNTRDHNTSGHSTRDHNNRCVNSTSIGCQSNGPSKLYPKVCHHTGNSRNDRNDGSGTDGLSDRNPLQRRCNLRHKSYPLHPHKHTLFHRHSCRARKRYHVYIQ